MRRERPTPPPVVALLVAILTDVEALPGALCVGQAPTFDRNQLDGEIETDHAERLRQARWVCGRCPVREGWSPVRQPRASGRVSQQ